jgi:hypothetical protein
VLQLLAAEQQNAADYENLSAAVAGDRAARYKAAAYHIN